MLKNFKKDAKIGTELENVNIENYLDFDYQGNYTFKQCEYCTGPLLGHIQPAKYKLRQDRNLRNEKIRVAYGHPPSCSCGGLGDPSGPQTLEL